MSEHVVAVRVGGKLIEKWSDYSIEVDMLQPADAFRLSLPGGGRKDIYDLCAPDSAVQVLIDDTVMMTGFIDDRKRTVERNGIGLAISGRDKGGRLVDESMPLQSFAGIGILQLAQAVAGPWFPEVTLSNAKNRRLLRGDAARAAHVSSEPAIDQKNRAQKKVNPGESRWATLAAFLEEAGLIAWSSADGNQLIVGQPNYSQEPQWRFTLPEFGSSRAAEGNVLSAEIEHNVGERYSAIIAVGSGQGNQTNYSERVTKLRGVVKNGPGEFGIGKDFQHRKVLIVSDDDVRSVDLALERAKREMATRDSTGHRINLTVRGHTQYWDLNSPAIFAPDTMALVEDEEIGLSALYLITSCTFGMGREGEQTQLTLVPKGTVLKL